MQPVSFRTAAAANQICGQLKGHKPYTEQAVQKRLLVRSRCAVAHLCGDIAHALSVD